MLEAEGQHLTGQRAQVNLGCSEALVLISQSRWAEGRWQGTVLETEGA